MRYCYARLSNLDFCAFRFLGPGLGNLLFPWGRMVVASQQLGCPKLWPTWPQIKFGPIFRRETDSRFYGGLFVNSGDYIDGHRKALVRLTFPRVFEEQEYDQIDQRERSLIVFEGMKGLFAPLFGNNEFLREELLKITSKEHLRGMSFDFSGSITVHMRMGDFRPANDALLRAGEWNVRIPIPWILDVIARMRSEFGASLPVWIFSDGTDEQLAELLCVPGVQRLNFGSALADMLAMSMSSTLIVSSTFSMWASYLGGVPSVYYPGLKRQQLLQASGVEIEHELGEIMPASFLKYLDKEKHYV